jgi:hypothetical protein
MTQFIASFGADFGLLFITILSKYLRKVGTEIFKLSAMLASVLLLNR